MGLLDRAIVTALPLVPRAAVERVARRYIAGPALADALRAARALNAEGKAATLDVLGEEVQILAEADELTRSYLDALRTIADEGLDANVSVKPTALGLALGRKVFRDNLTRVVEAAAVRGNFVRIDMEDSSTTDATLATYRELRAAGHENLGIVLQAVLRRSEADVRALAALRPSVRVCKGIYLEPEEIAYHDPWEVRRSFVRIVAELLDAGSDVAVATHDDWLLEECREVASDHGLSPGGYEVQFLLGVRADVATRLVAEGHRLRVYVPFGPRWYEYSVRRLRENPRLATTVAASLLRLPGTRR